MQNLYLERSEKERIGLNMLFNKIYKGIEGRDFFKYSTPAEGFDCYDGGGGILNNGSRVKSQIFEVKVRDTHYPELMLEKIKLEALNKKAKEFDADAYYVNITPSGCYIFKLKDTIEYEWIKEMHWASTTDKSRGKKLKSLVYIPLSDGRVYNDITRKLIEEEFIKSKTPNISKDIKCKNCGLDFFFETKK